MDMVSGATLDHRRQGEVCNKYTGGSDIEVNPERNNFDVTTKLS